MLTAKHSPIYIVSKGRADSRLTSKALEVMGVPYYIVIEEQEYDQYAAVINPAKILILDKQYQADYDPCDDLGDTKSKGPGAARNFVWNHAIGLGAAWHWVMDDNIRTFKRFNNNIKTPVKTGAIFRAAEDFCNRYKNIAIAGLDYFMFIPARQKHPPFILNTRIYSCLFIRNDIPYRWRGRYNEDTDLSIRVLKDGWCTVQFCAFLQEKMRTQTLKGGNTEAFYTKEGTLPKSAMIVNLHPDVCKLLWRFGRVHHYCNYKLFKDNKLIRKDGVTVPSEVNNYGMELVGKVKPVISRKG